MPCEFWRNERDGKRACNHPEWEKTADMVDVLIKNRECTLFNCPKLHLPQFTVKEHNEKRMNDTGKTVHLIPGIICGINECKGGVEYIGNADLIRGVTNVQCTKCDKTQEMKL